MVWRSARVRRKRCMLRSVMRERVIRASDCAASIHWECSGGDWRKMPAEKSKQ